MTTRLDFHTKLVDMFGTNVYFQPPAKHLMKYPCVLYSLSDIAVTHADSRLYKTKDKYIVTRIHTNMDSEDHRQLLTFPYSRFDRQYVADNLVHSIYEIYF